jgi:hypothetical protein
LRAALATSFAMAHPEEWPTIMHGSFGLVSGQRR